MTDKNNIASPFIFVESSTSLGETLHLMKQDNLSFVLVDDKNGKLVGIFTLKDLIKNIDFLKVNTYLKKPIRVFMSRPVLTLPSHQINKAEEIMVKNNIRHLPVTGYRPQDRGKIIGVVDMESLLQTRVTTIRKTKTKKILIYSPNGSLLKFFQKSLIHLKDITSEKLWASKIRSEEHGKELIEQYDTVIFDILENKDLRVALRLKKEILKQKKKFFCLVDKSHFTGILEKELIDGLVDNFKITVYEKPINAHQLLEDVIN